MTQYSVKAFRESCNAFANALKDEISRNEWSKTRTENTTDGILTICHIALDTFKSSFRAGFVDPEDIVKMEETMIALKHDMKKKFDMDLNPMDDAEMEKLFAAIEVDKEALYDTAKAVELGNPLVDSIHQYRELGKAVEALKDAQVKLDTNTEDYSAKYLQNLIHGFIDGLRTLAREDTSLAFNVGINRGIEFVVNTMNAKFLDVLNVTVEETEEEKAFEDLAETIALLKMKMCMIAGQEFDPNNMRQASKVMEKLGITAKMISDDPKENINSENEFISLFYTYHNMMALQALGTTDIRIEDAEETNN